MAPIIATRRRKYWQVRTRIFFTFVQLAGTDFPPIASIHSNAGILTFYTMRYPSSILGSFVMRGLLTTMMSWAPRLAVYSFIVTTSIPPRLKYLVAYLSRPPGDILNIYWNFKRIFFLALGTRCSLMSDAPQSLHFSVSDTLIAWSPVLTGRCFVPPYNELHEGPIRSTFSVLKLCTSEAGYRRLDRRLL